MQKIKEALESFIQRSSPKTPEEEALVQEAGRLLTELLRLEGRARRILELDPLWWLGAGREFGLFGREPHVAPDDPRTNPSIPFSNAGTGLAGLSLHEAAHKVLEEEGRPMHVQELGARIKARGWRHPRSRSARPDQINFQLAARLPRHPETFRRVAPNTFGLTVWEDSAPIQQRPKPRLPLFSSFDRAPDGRPWSEWIGDHPEAAAEDETARWRSS